MYDGQRSGRNAEAGHPAGIGISDIIPYSGYAASAGSVERSHSFDDPFFVGVRQRVSGKRLRSDGEQHAQRREPLTAFVLSFASRNGRFARILLIPVPRRG